MFQVGKVQKVAESRGSACSLAQLKPQPCSHPIASFSRQAARSSLSCAGNSPTAQQSPTISVALKPKCWSGRGRATPSHVPLREYYRWREHGWKKGKSSLPSATPKSQSSATVPEEMSALCPLYLCFSLCPQLGDRELV